MTDRFPSDITIEIDRTRLRRYLRVRYFLSCVGVLSGFGVLFGLCRGASILEHSDQLTIPGALLVLAKWTGTGLAIGLLIGTVLYFVLSHRFAARLSSRLSLSVEGPFLCLHEVSFFESDRKLHFRSIVEYTVVQGKLMRMFGVQMLQMMTTAGSIANMLRIPGVKDCLAVRDMLAEIDAARETG